jgi:protein-tyrosine-phosphatase
MAEAVARRMAEELQLPVMARSAGVAAHDDAPATPQAIAAAGEAGLDLGRHEARLLTRPMVLEAALVLTMDEAQRAFIRVLAPEAMERVHVLRDYATRGAETGGVPDPVGGDLARYRRALGELRGLVEQSLQRWVEDAESRRP